MSAEENALERALRLGADDPTQRLRFYVLLLEFKLFTLTATDLGIEGDVVARADTQVLLKMWPRADNSVYIPVFTSLNALQHAIKGDDRFIAMDGRTLLEITRGKTLILNPYGPYSKELAPEEIDSLLSQDAGRSVKVNS